MQCNESTVYYWMYSTKNGNLACLLVCMYMHLYTRYASMQFRCVQGNVCQLRTLAHNICTWHCTVRVPDPSSHYQFECVHVLFILATEHWLRARRTLTHSWRVSKLNSSTKGITLTDSYDYSSIHNVSTYILYTRTCVVCGVPFIIVEPFCI